MTHSTDYGGLRTDVMAKARRRVHELADEGLSTGEIEARLDGSLTRTEQELLGVFTRSEVAAARRGRVTDSLEPGSGWVARQGTGSMSAAGHEEKVT
jgi:isoaspartyl peptidase/L-asparaginase-like protein (Ntn-hydrolase superfamily)